jgi:RHS repeat-associated protein
VDVLLDWWYYDDLGRVVDQYQRDNLWNWRRATYTYFADGQLDTMDRYTYDSPNWTKLLTTQWTYDGAGRIDDLKHFKADGTTLLAGYGYGFDAAGRMTSMDFSSDVRNNDAEDVTTFGYDRTNQMLSGERSGTSNDEAYAYDGAGNRTSANGASYTTSSNNRLTNDGTFTYTYDDEGNRLTKVRISGAAADDKTVEYQWDYRNRLEKVTFKRNDGTVTKRVEHYYDMFNRWTKRVLDYDGDTGSATPRVDRLIYDGDVLIQDFTEYSDSHSFMHGPLPDMVIFDYHEDELRIPLGDHLNTIRDVVAHDGSDWNIVNHVTIDSFGRRIDESDDTIEVFHGLGGRPYDEETGLQNHLHRWYSVDTGRWMSEDPIGFAGGHANLNVYTGNSPVNGVDPLGLAPVNPAARAAWLHRRLVEMATLQAYADMQRIVDAGSEQSVAGQFGLGLVQGGLNTVNGVQDIVAGAINTPADIWNSTAGALGAPLAPTLESTDWSNGLAVDESDTAHNISKFLGGTGVAILAGVGVRGGPKNPGGGMCFVAGTPVVLGSSLDKAVTGTSDELAMPEESGPTNKFLMTTVLLVCAARVAAGKVRRKGENGSSFSDGETDGGENTVLSDASERGTDAREEFFASQCPATESEDQGAAIAELRWDNDFQKHCPQGRRTTRLSASSGARRLASKIAGWACLSACLVVVALLSFSKRDAGRIDPPRLERGALSRQETAPIETVRVGHRVVALAYGGDMSATFETSVDPATWRRLRLQAIEIWEDGTRDTIEVETLQSPEWLAEHGAQVGGDVPLPLDLHEMGLSQNVKGRVVADEPCPPIVDGPGRVVLTTVSHLNPDVWQLDIVDAAGKAQSIRPTGSHKFYSVSRADWVCAEDLRPGEKLRGLAGTAEVRSVAHVSGIHRVYNMTVEGEHVYRVSAAGVLVHNTCPKQGPKHYPKLAGKQHDHHIDPIYLGGAKNGPKVKIDASYHQNITNEFRKHWPYGSGKKPSPKKLEEIKKKVYGKYPYSKH